GHYFGLLHVFEGCNNADGIDDTPDQNRENYFCPDFNFGTCTSTAHNSCGEPDFYFNFMDYVNDACMVMFTTDQAAVMSAAGNHGLWKQTVFTLCGTYDAPALSDDLVQNTCPFSIINLG
ncbi:M43 family zinc metalloprotease, partial [Arthrospira platensis SPKY1]|nr:M43 family zinc metalloprotease [Arthrospira platensis SPKY1]